MLTHLDLHPKISTKRRLTKQTNIIFHISHFQKFCTIILVYWWEYEKKIHSKRVQKFRLCFFPGNPICQGTSFVQGSRMVKFQNFDTRIGSYGQKISKLLIFGEIPKVYHKFANLAVHCLLKLCDISQLVFSVMITG